MRGYSPLGLGMGMCAGSKSWVRIITITPLVLTAGGGLRKTMFAGEHPAEYLARWSSDLCLNAPCPKSCNISQVISSKDAFLLRRVGFATVGTRLFRESMSALAPPVYGMLASNMSPIVSDTTGIVDGAPHRVRA